MKSLSQSEYGELRSLYSQVYAPKFETVLDELTDQEVDELTEEVIEEVVEEFFLECLEEGWDIESVEETLCESLDASITNLNETYLMEMNPYAPAGSKESKAYNRATTASKRSADRAAKRKEVIGKVKKAVGKVGSALKAGAGKAAGAAKAGAKAAGKAAGAARQVLRQQVRQQSVVLDTLLVPLGEQHPLLSLNSRKDMREDRKDLLHLPATLDRLIAVLHHLHRPLVLHHLHRLLVLPQVEALVGQ